jgi:hypothetical protein
MATFSNQQYNQRVLTNVSDVVIAASDQGGNNQLSSFAVNRK